MAETVATSEQIASFDLFLSTLNASEAAAVRQSWKLAQAFGYKTASKRVFEALVEAPTPITKAA